MILSVIKYNEENSKFKLYVLLAIVLIAFATFRDGDKVRDYSNYIYLYNLAQDGALFDVEYSFEVISLFVNFVFGNVVFLFFIYAFIGVSIKLFAIKELTEFWFMSLMIYICNFYILHELTQIRAGIAAGLLLLCVKPIYERKFKLFILFFTIAIFFHYSALVILPLWFLGYKINRNILLAAIPLAYIIYILNVNLIAIIPIDHIQYKMELYLQLQKMGGKEWSEINVFNSILLLKIFVFYILMFNIEYLKEKNKYIPLLVNIFCFSLMSFPIFANIPIVGFRINELLGIVEIILIPLLIYLFKPKIFAKLIVVGIGIIYLYVSVVYNKYIIF